MSVAFQIILFPAIISGILANFLAENLGLGPLAPFAMAVPCFLVCFFVVLMTWEENYGDSVSTVTFECNPTSKKFSVKAWRLPQKSY